jgi:hypothetical protein
VLVLTGDWLDEEGVEDVSSPAGVGGENSGERAGGGAMGMGASTELLWWKAGTQREKGGTAFLARGVCCCRSTAVPVSD